MGKQPIVASAATGLLQIWSWHAGVIKTKNSLSLMAVLSRVLWQQVPQGCSLAQVGIYILHLWNDSFSTYVSKVQEKPSLWQMGRTRFGSKASSFMKTCSAGLKSHLSWSLCLTARPWLFCAALGLYNWLPKDRVVFYVCVTSSSSQYPLLYQSCSKWLSEEEFSTVG